MTVNAYVHIKISIWKMCMSHITIELLLLVHRYNTITFVQTTALNGAKEINVMMKYRIEQWGK